MGANVMLTNHH